MKKTFLEEFRKYFIFNSGSWVKLYLKTNPMLSEGCIVDVETTGLNPGPGDYYNSASHVLTLGIYQGPLIRIYQLTKPEYSKFLELCRRIARKTPTPRYAYAAHFEQQFLGIPEGWHDLTKHGTSRDPYDNDWNYNPYYRLKLVDATRNPCPTREDWDIDGSEIPLYWEKWLKTKDPRVLAEISYHNYVDLIRERQLC